MKYGDTPEPSMVFCDTCGVRINEEHDQCDCEKERDAPYDDEQLQDMDVLGEGEVQEDYDLLESGDEEDDVLFTSLDEDEPRRFGLDEEEQEYESDEEDRMSESLINQLGGAIKLNSGDFSTSQLRDLSWTRPSRAFERLDVKEYPNLQREPARPVDRLMEIAYSPLALFFEFLPHSTWKEIAFESNRFAVQSMESRVDTTIAFQRKKHATDPRVIVESRATIRTKLKRKPIEPHELTTVIGLLLAHVLCPQVRRMAHHWSMTEDGAIPAGTFGKYMPRNRFTIILRDLHFVNNQENRPVYDKCWKIRPIITTLQKRFMRAWTLPPVFSFDEGVLPSFSRMNTTRTYMKDKPHKWGTKMFLACDSNSAYCHRYLYCLLLRCSLIGYYKNYVFI